MAVSEGERVIGLLAEGASAPRSDNGSVFVASEPTERVGLPEALDELRLRLELGGAGPGRRARVGDFLPEPAARALAAWRRRCASACWGR